MNVVATAAPRTAQTYKSAYRPIWCPGCGDYSVLSSVTKALASLGLPPEEIVVVSGIGCCWRFPAYTNC
jgi:2-oxoglutarate ferredoxin oxidoreductase subunit beta